MAATRRETPDLAKLKICGVHDSFLRMLIRPKEPSFELQKRVLGELLHLGDHCWELVGLLEQAGWNTFRSRIDFETSFAVNEKEREEYRRAAMEHPRLQIAHESSRFGTNGPPPIDSEYFRQLRQERDEEYKRRGLEVPLGEELLKCRRRAQALQRTDRPEYERRKKELETQEGERRVHEVARHASGISRQFRNPPEDLDQFYVAVMERESGPLGFALDRTRSTRNYIVLSRCLKDEWDFCLTPEPLAWYPGRNDGALSILPSLQPRRHRQPIKRADPTKVVTIEYTSLVPHFEGRYCQFTNLDELEVIIMARMFLLSLLMKDIEAGVLSGLAKFDAAEVSK